MRRKEIVQDVEEEVTENKLWVGMSREDLKLYLEARRFGRQYVSPGMLLLQLQFGAIEGEAIMEAIMQFDDEAIQTALSALLDMGLE